MYDNNVDFQSVSEEPEEYTGPMVDCPQCGRPVHSDALLCLYCGGSLSAAKRGKRKAVYFLVAAGILALIIIFVLQRI